MSKSLDEILSGCHIWVGYYVPSDGKTPILLCVSESKKEVKQYLKTYRGLSKGEYQIIHEEVSYGDLLAKYENYIIGEWNGHRIPFIDQMTMSLVPDFKSRFLKDAILELHHIAGYSEDIQQITREEKAILKRGVQILLRFDQNKKILDRLSIQYLNDTLFAPIDQHLKNTDAAVQILNLDSQWRDSIHFN